MGRFFVTILPLTVVPFIGIIHSFITQRYIVLKVFYWFCAVVVALVCLIAITHFEQMQFVKYLNQQGYSNVTVQYKWTVGFDSKCMLHNKNRLYSFVAKEGSGVVCQKGFAKVHEVTGK